MTNLKNAYANLFSTYTDLLRDFLLAADVIVAAEQLIEYVHDKYPDEQLTCPYMQAVENALEKFTKGTDDAV
jgi:hypothetical protein